MSDHRKESRGDTESTTDNYVKRDAAHMPGLIQDAEGTTTKTTGVWSSRWKMEEHRIHWALGSKIGGISSVFEHRDTPDYVCGTGGEEVPSSCRSLFGDRRPRA